MANSPKLTVVIPENLKEELRQAAETEQRTMSQLVVIILKNWLSERAATKTE